LYARDLLKLCLALPVVSFNLLTNQTNNAIDSGVAENIFWGDLSGKYVKANVCVKQQTINY
jgi:hypothetical protein